MIKNFVFTTLALLAFSANAAVEVSGGWARATAPGQDVGAAYMHLRSDRAASLVEASSPIADSIEIHEMSMKNGVMKMRMLESFPLPAGKTVKLEPGGFHLMLFDLKKPLAAGANIELVLSIKDTKGKIEKLKVSIPVKRD